MTHPPSQPPDKAGVVERLTELVDRLNADHGGVAYIGTCLSETLEVRAADIDAALNSLALSPPPVVEEAGRGFDAAVAAIEVWAAGFIGPSVTASHLRLTANDLRRNRETILANISKGKTMERSLSLTSALDARHYVDHAYAALNDSSATEPEKAAVRKYLQLIDALLRSVTCPNLYSREA